MGCGCNREPGLTVNWVVSIGTGAARQPIRTGSAFAWVQAQWAAALIDCMFSGSSDAVDYAMRQTVPSAQYKRSGECRPSNEACELLGRLETESLLING